MENKALNHRNIDFLKISKYTVIIAVSFMVIGVISMIAHKGLTLGVDFAGGKQLRLSFNQDVSVSRDNLTEIFKSVGVKPSITAINDIQDQKEFFVYYQNSNNSLQEKIVSAINSKFGKKVWHIESQSFVGPKIGSQFTKTAVYATLITFFLMLIYIGVRFQFRFGIGALVALIHDVFLTLTFISLFNISFDIPILAAILSIVGYSLNDTIVIFDRIRSEIKLQEDHITLPHYYKMINTSINKSLTRTLLTAGTTISVLLILFFVGVSDLKPMSLVLMMGVLIGTSSSNLIAPPLLYLWYKKEFNKAK